MKTLFQRDKSVISRHIRDIFNEGELDPEVVVAKNATTTRHGAIADKTQTHEKLVYNLDVIISVGYRVKSKRGTQFRIWATSVLKEYLIKGYAVRSNLAQQKYEDLKALVEVVGRTMGYLEGPKNDQIKPIFDVVRDYTYVLDTLDAYDYQKKKTCSSKMEYQVGVAREPCLMPSQSRVSPCYHRFCTVQQPFKSASQSSTPS